MTTHTLPLDDRDTCAELFKLACELNDMLQRSHGAEMWELVRRFETLRDDIHDGEQRATRVTYPGFLQTVARDFPSRDKAENWARCVGLGQGTSGWRHGVAFEDITL